MNPSEVAAMVLFRPTPSKLRAAKNKPDGTIDIAAVLADPPASMSPRGYYVAQSVFLAKGTSPTRGASEV
jgi:hypothetical protein